MATKKKAAEAKSASASAASDDVLSTRQDRAAAFMANFNKSMKGHAMVKRASDYSLPYLTRRLPTGLLSLDLELRGGFPAGGLSQIAGPKNSGKSYLTWQVIRQLQHILGDKMMVLLAMTEMRADRLQARLAGVQIALANEDIAEMEKARMAQGQAPFAPDEIASLKHEVGMIHELHGESAESLYDGILLAVEQDIYHLIVIDSFGSIMSEMEAESESLSEKQYAGSSGVNTKFCRKLSALLTIDTEEGKARSTAIIGINQIRDNIGDPNKEWKTPGGRALEHTKFVDVWVQSGKQVGYEDKVFTPEGNKQRYIQTGKEVNWKIEKGKAGIHEGGKGTYVYDFRVNAADFYLDTLVAGVRHGIIEQAGPYLGIRDPNNPSEYLLRAQGRENFVRALIEDDRAKAAAGTPETSLMNTLRNIAFRKEGIFISYDWE